MSYPTSCVCSLPQCLWQNIQPKQNGEGLFPPKWLDAGGKCRGLPRALEQGMLGQETLKHLFWSGMDNIPGQMLLLRQHRCSFTEFVDYTSWLCGPPSPWESLRITTPSPWHTFHRQHQSFYLLQADLIVPAWSVLDSMGDLTLRIWIWFPSPPQILSQS